MKRVFVSGMAGFLGSHVAELFTSKGWEVVGMDNLTKFELARTDYNVEAARNYNVDFLKSIGAELMRGDIRDYKQVLTASARADYIINCAAQPAMTIALEKPGYDAENNIMGTLNILQAARALGVPAAICSTIHVYGNGINNLLTTVGDCVDKRLILPCYPNGIDEDWDEYLSGLITPLHVSKYTTELYARAFSESYGSNIFTADLP